MHLYSVSCTVRFRSTSWWEYVRWRFTTLHKKYSLHEIDYFPNHCKGYFYVTQKYHGWESPPFLKSCVLQGPATSCKSLHRYIITPQAMCWTSWLVCGWWVTLWEIIAWGFYPLMMDFYRFDQCSTPFHFQNQSIRTKFSFLRFLFIWNQLRIHLWNNNIGSRLGVYSTSNKCRTLRKGGGGDWRFWLTDAVSFSTIGADYNEVRLLFHYWVFRTYIWEGWMRDSKARWRTSSYCKAHLTLTKILQDNDWPSDLLIIRNLLAALKVNYPK